MSNVRQRWRAAYRLLRIVRREADKATVDLFTYGASVVRVRPDGEAEHIPLAQVTILRRTAGTTQPLQ